MEFQVNRFHKDDRSGYAFVRKTGLFLDKQLCSAIQEAVVGRVIGNGTVTAWISCVVNDMYGKPYFVFGHNWMHPQERNSDRLSADFLFVTAPFAELKNVADAAALMVKISEREKTLSMDPLPFAPSAQPGGQADEKLAEVLAAVLVDREIGLSVTAPVYRCTDMLSQVWRTMPFPEAMPTIAYVDKPTVTQPQHCWIFTNHPQMTIQPQGMARLSNVTPEKKYLCRAGKVILGAQNSAFREMYRSPEAQKQFDEKIGQKNSALRKQLMIWNFAIDNNVSAALPTEAEKRYLLGRLQ